MILKWILIFFIQFILQLANRVHIKCNKVMLPVACENIRFSSLFAAGDVSRNVPSDEERGETDVFAGYATSLNCSNAGSVLGQTQWIETNPYKSISGFIHLLNK